jgi:hypothetical protein
MPRRTPGTEPDAPPTVAPSPGAGPAAGSGPADGPADGFDEEAGDPADPWRSPPGAPVTPVVEQQFPIPAPAQPPAGESVLRAVRELAGDRPLPDDLTVTSLRRLP